MTRDEAVKFIRESNGRIFSLVFKKRTTGEMREMVCRTGVTKHLAGGTQSYDSVKKGLLNVFDMAVGGYRSIPVEGIARIKVDGVWREVGDGDNTPQAGHHRGVDSSGDAGAGRQDGGPLEQG